MQDTVWFSLIVLAAVIIIGLHEWRYERKLQKAREKKEDDREFERYSDEEFERKVQELRESMEGRGCNEPPNESG